MAETRHGSGAITITEKLALEPRPRDLGASPLDGFPMIGSTLARLRQQKMDFWIEWSSTVVLITGVLLTSLNIYPANLVFNFVGNLGWFAIGFLWRKYSLIVVQTVILAIYFGGIAANLPKLLGMA